MRRVEPRPPSRARARVQKFHPRRSEDCQHHSGICKELYRPFRIHCSSRKVVASSTLSWRMAGIRETEAVDSKCVAQRTLKVPCHTQPTRKTLTRSGRGRPRPHGRLA